MVRINDLAEGPFWKLLGIEAVTGDDGEVMLKVPVEVVHLGRTLAVAGATVWDDRDRKIAHGTATFYLIDVNNR